MQILSGNLVERIQRTPTVESFRFRLEKKLDFLPGQFMKVIFDKDNPEDKELNKYLSFSSSPGKDYIEVTKRLSESAFSRRLRNLKIGDKVEFKLPLGACIFKDEYKKIAFLIGGIGITPAISIIEHIVERKLATDVYLLYSNRTFEEIAFKAELDAWKVKNPNLKICYTLTDCTSKDGQCIQGAINKELLTCKIVDLKERIIFVFGPPKMVEAMNNLCLESGCGKENLKIERFLGY